MKTCAFRGYCVHQISSSNINISFTLDELKEYYKTIKNNPNVPNSFKLKIANAIIDAK